MNIDGREDASREELNTFLREIIKSIIPKEKVSFIEKLCVCEVEVKPVEKINDIEGPSLGHDKKYSEQFLGDNPKAFSGIKIWCNIPEELSYWTDFYLFIIYLVSINDEQIASGVTKDVSGYVISKDKLPFLEDVVLLREMYVKNYFERNELPSSDFFTQLSAEQYEKGEANAKITFLKENAENFVEYKFKTPYEFMEDNSQIIRKLMETTKNSGMTLVAKQNEKHGWSLIGLGNETKTGYNIWFKGKLSWFFVEDEKTKFKYYKGIYELSEDEGKDSKEYSFELHNIREEYRGVVESIISVLKEQKHGTAAIVSGDPSFEDEVKRLCDMKKGIGIERVNFLPDSKDDNFIKQVGVTNIDGAIFIDLDGMCHAIGVIVDGETIIEGHEGRGSRYNSIKNYVNWLNKARHEGSYYVGIIVSEDGKINIVQPE